MRAGCGVTLVFNIGKFVAVVRKGGSQCRIVGMGLGIVPTYLFFAAIKGVTVVKQFTVAQVEVFKDTQFKPVVETDAPAHECSGRAIRVEQ